MKIKLLVIISFLSFTLVSCNKNTDTVTPVTPVADANQTVYVSSSDHKLYAIDNYNGYSEMGVHHWNVFVFKPNRI